jgi:hypothetical protein
MKACGLLWLRPSCEDFGGGLLSPPLRGSRRGSLKKFLPALGRNFLQNPRVLLCNCRSLFSNALCGSLSFCGFLAALLGGVTAFLLGVFAALLLAFAFGLAALFLAFFTASLLAVFAAACYAHHSHGCDQKNLLHTCKKCIKNELNNLFRLKKRRKITTFFLYVQEKSEKNAKSVAYFKKKYYLCTQI